MNIRNYIEIRDLALKCRLGVTNAERSHPQKIFITLRIYGNFKRPMKSDDINDTVDYTKIINSVESLVQKKSFRLIECLACAIRQTVLDLCGNKHIEIHIIKPSVLRDAQYAAFILRNQTN